HGTSDFIDFKNRSKLAGARCMRRARRESFASRPSRKAVPKLLAVRSRRKQARDRRDVANVDYAVAVDIRTGHESGLSPGLANAARGQKHIGAIDDAVAVDVTLGG